MANIALVTADTSHASYVNTRGLLVSGGHSVTGFTSYTAETLAAYDIIVAVRTENNSNKNNVIKQALDMGTPVLISHVSGTFNSTISSDGPAITCGICSSVATNDGINSSLTLRNHEIFGPDISGQFSPYASAGFFYLIPGSSIAPSAIKLAVVSPTDDRVSIAILPEGSLNIVGGTVNAPVGFCGFIYGVNGYSNKGTQIILRMVDFLLARRYLRGTVKDAENRALRRKLRAFIRSDGSFAGETYSDAMSGQYELKVSQDTVYTVVCYDEDGGTKNALVKDRVISVEE